MQSPSEEEATPLSQLHPNDTKEEEEQEPQKNIIPKPNDIKELEVQKEEENVKEEMTEEGEEEEREHEKDGNHSKSLSSSAFYSTISSFDNENERRILVDPVSLTEVRFKKL